MRAAHAARAALRPRRAPLRGIVELPGVVAYGAMCEADVTAAALQPPLLCWDVVSQAVCYYSFEARDMDTNDEKFELGANAPILGPVVQGVVSEVAANVPLGNLLVDWLLGSSKEQLQTFAWEVASELDLLGYRIGRLESLQQRDHVLRLFRDAAFAFDAEKRQRLRNAALNVIIEDVEDSWFAILDDCINKLTAHEVALLRTIYAAKGLDFINVVTFADFPSRLYGE